MFKISVYGKGGIGKSTMSSNLSYMLSKTGRKVLHVGCDPKHDSTRLLTNGVSQKTFMDALVENTEEGIMETGSNGIACVECGGAEPGIGCAGKGMISMFNYIARNTPPDTDVRVCDVLGDVVCGGFSVPMRRKEVNGIVLVVSEDFMSIYAANNLLRGIRNLNGSECIIGMVLNSRSPEDRIRVEQFSKATGIPVISTVEKSGLFSQSEAAGKTVAELFPDSEAAMQISDLTNAVIEAMEGRRKMVRARPLNDTAMTQIAAGQEITDFSEPEVRIKCRFDTVDRERGLVYKGDQAMPACTSHGAVEVLLSIKDAAIVLHGPRNCAFLMEYAWVRRSYLMAPGKKETYPDNLYSTGMDSTNVFTGDREILHDTIQRAIDDGFRTVFVVQSCTPDTIGTDVYSVINGFDREQCNIIAVEPDQYFLGSKFGGYSGGVDALASLIDWNQPVEKGRVALIGFQPNYLGHGENAEVIRELLSAFGLHLGSIFIDNTSVAEINSLATCEYFIKLGWGPFGNKLADRVIPEGRNVLQLDAPMLMTGLQEWCDKLSEVTGMKDVGERFMQSKWKEFEDRISDIKDRHRGKKVVFYQRSAAYLDPLIDILKCLGIETLARISWTERYDDPIRRPTKYGDLPSYKDVEVCCLKDRLTELGADLVITGDSRVGRTGFPWAGSFTGFLGLKGCIEWVEKLDNCFGLRSQMKWKEVEM